MKKHNYLYSTLSGDVSKLFSWKMLGLSGVGLCTNLLLANLVKLLGIPLYIDNVGSVLVGALAGPIPGMMVGFLSNVINAIGDPITMYYGILTVIMAMCASIYTQKRMFRHVRGCIFIVLSYIGIGGAIGSIMTWFLYGGGIGGTGAGLATFFNEKGIPAFFAQIMADVIIDIPDKTITVCLVLILLKICSVYLPKTFPLSRYYVDGVTEEDQEAAEISYRSYSVKSVILGLILACSILISTATIWISFSMYCKENYNLQGRLIYLIELVSVSFAITLIICAVAIWIASKRIAGPIQQLVVQSQQFRNMPAEDWLWSPEWKDRIVIHTGDEIELLYETLCAEQETVAKNVIEMQKTQEKLRHSKELEDALKNARQASQAKGQFLSRMSHEIRTPLNAVIGYMDIAKDSMDMPDKMLHCVQNSEMAAKHLLNIINDVLDISSIESGKMKIAHEEFNLKDQITTVSTLFYNQCREKEVEFEATIQELDHEWVVGDSLRLNQILMNLLSNAVKFTAEGGKVTLTMTQMTQNSSNVFLKFIVSDTGIGMSEEFQKRLFTPFEQESAMTAQKYGGTGLGLSITGNLISMMGGAIEVKSRQGEGTTFTVTLPVELSEKAHESAEADYGKLRALVVDDKEDNCEYTKKLLKRCGVKSDTVTSGEAAIRQIKKRENSEYAYDFCILDWNMPGMDGIETCRRIHEESTKDMPVLIATAYDITGIEEEAAAAGVKKVISKPLFQSTIFDFLVSTYGKYKVESRTNATHMDLTGIRILLAEDNAMNREIAVDILEKAHIVIDTVENGQEAVDRFTNGPDQYDVILMDIQMPVMDGYEATRKIRSSELPQAKTIPIVAMTANAFHEDVAAALACGMNEHIAKPIDYDKLFSVLQKIEEKTH